MLARLMLATTFFGALSLAAAPTQAAKTADDGPDGRFEIDAVHSGVMFKIKHMDVSNFYGRFDKVGGKLLIDGDNPAESLISLVIDANSVDTNDDERDKHLRSPDFFNVAEFGDITFDSEKVTAKGKDQFEIEGTLKLHGVEKTVVAKAERTGFGSFGADLGTRIGFEARIVVKRTDFGMDYATHVLGDEVEILVSLEGVRK